MRAMSARLTLQETSNLIGYPRRCLLNRFVREGLLPYPRQSDLTYARTDVQALADWMQARRDRTTDKFRRPDHRTW